MLSTLLILECETRIKNGVNLHYSFPTQFSDSVVTESEN